MSDTKETGPRKPRAIRKPSRPALTDDWASVAGARPGAAGTPNAARQRVAKAMARAGLCSRRDAEAWILDGRVSVNGEVLASPARDVGPDDRVEVDGAPLPTAEKTRLFLFHKPRGLVTSDHDPEGRATIFDHLREHWPDGPRVVTVGRLDINTEGLLLLTNDGGLARMLELPKTGWLRRYRVRANGETDQARLDALAGGITIDEVDYAGIEAKLDRVQGANCWLTMGLREGKNREIKRVLEHLGLEVNRLIRLSFGPFQLLDLAEGAVEEVRTRVLKDQLGAALAAEAGVDFGDAAVTSASPAGEPAPVAKAVKAVGEGQATSGKTSPGRERTDPSRARRTNVGDPRPKQSRAGERGESRVLRRPQGAAAQIAQEHNLRKPRRHVSTLRTTEAAAERDGPRKRIERSDTRDRNDRAVTVERKVSTRPARSLSPAAEGKRARIARSGATRRDKASLAVRDDRRGGTSNDGNGQRPMRSRAGRPGEPDRSARRGDEAARAGRAAPARRGSGGSGDDRSKTSADGRGSGRSARPRRDERDRGAGSRHEGTATDKPNNGQRTTRRDDGGTIRRKSADRSDAAGRSRSKPGGSAGDRPVRKSGGSDRAGPRGGSARGGSRPANGGKGGGRFPRGGSPERPKR